MAIKPRQARNFGFGHSRAQAGRVDYLTLGPSLASAYRGKWVAFGSWTSPVSHPPRSPVLRV
jgi:hypothetical protein